MTEDERQLLCDAAAEHDDECPEAKRIGKPGKKEAGYQQTIKALHGEVNSYRDQNATLRSKLSDAELQSDRLREECANLQKACDDIFDKYHELERHSKWLEEQLVTQQARPVMTDERTAIINMALEIFGGKLDEACKD